MTDCSGLLIGIPPQKQVPDKNCSSLTDDITCNEREREMFYLTTHSTHFIYGYMASDIWLRTILIVRRKPAAAT